MNMENTVPGNLIRRPDGSYVDLADLEPRHQLAHELVSDFFPMAEEQSQRLFNLKKNALSEMQAYRRMMLDDYGVSVGGKEGNLTLRTVCGTRMMKLTVSKTVTFGPVLEAAKALIDEFLEREMAKGGSEHIHAIVTKVFRINSKGRVDTSGILGLREHRFADPLWDRAMDAIENAVCRDTSTIYLNFYRVDPTKNPKLETLLPLDLAKV